MWTASQRILLIGATIVFGVRLLMHWWTGLLVSAIGMFYSLFAAGVLLLALLCTFLMLVAWVSVMDPTTRQQRRQWFFTYLLISLIAVATTVVHAAYSRGLPVGSFVKSFDQQAWIDPKSSEYSDGDITPRQKMLGDVVQSIVRKGTRADILTHLGPPIVGRLPGPDVDTTYFTGPQRDSFFRIDDEWLSIWFDESGRVTRWEVWSD